MRELRNRTGWTCLEWAVFLGVGQSTAYRWEQQADREIRIDPMQAKILELLTGQIEQHGDSIVREVQAAHLLRGGLYALYRVLRYAYEENP